ncbi:chromate transporter [Mycoplasmopsis columboralis]|uniref:Chromate transporter n=1 Tax=Mycoplasmopsis columboralis TaxID=171282 RepID=A0A449B6W8_9BACT|nr:chromate transporter [Mycoplasmopsis columboralis]VEU76350.1 chromate transporter [Mycoplasmopsis columboralis]
MNNSHSKIKPSLKELVLFILKITFFGFGGGNAMLPLIKSEAVEKKKWLNNEEFDEMVIITNMLPGPSTTQCITYIVRKFYNLFVTYLLVLIAILPHILFAFGVFLLLNYIPRRYIYVIGACALMPVVAGVILITYRYIKRSQQALKLPVWLTVACISTCYCLFVPFPYNLPVFVFGLLFLCTLIYCLITWSVLKRKSKDK